MIWLNWTRIFNKFSSSHTADNHAQIFKHHFTKSTQIFPLTKYVFAPAACNPFFDVILIYFQSQQANNTTKHTPTTSPLCYTLPIPSGSFVAIKTTKHIYGVYFLSQALQHPPGSNLVQMYVFWQLFEVWWSAHDE